MTTKVRIIVGSIVVVVVALAGVAAYAYFSSSGTGSDIATTGEIEPVTVTAFTGGDAPSSQLAPGGSADVVLRIDNPNAAAVTLTSVAGGPAPITADAGHAACTTTGVTFANQTGLSSVIGPGGTTLVHLPGAASMSLSSSSGCQGATFDIPVSISVRT